MSDYWFVHQPQSVSGLFTFKLNFRRSNDVIGVTPPLGRFENSSDGRGTNGKHKVTLDSKKQERD